MTSLFIVIDVSATVLQHLIRTSEWSEAVKTISLDRNQVISRQKKIINHLQEQKKKNQTLLFSFGIDQ